MALMQVRWINIFKNKANRRESIPFLLFKGSKIRQSDKLKKVIGNISLLFLMDSCQNNVFTTLKNTLNLLSTGAGLEYVVICSFMS